MYAYLVFLFVGLIGCSSSKHMVMPGFDYISSNKIYLDVKDIDIESRYQPPKKGKIDSSALFLPLTHWLDNRFIAAGLKGKATIIIENVEIVEKNINTEKDAFPVLNKKGESQYGARVTVRCVVENTHAYKKGEAKTDIERVISVKSDLNLVFKEQLWAQFVQTLVNELDKQFISDIKRYTPRVVLSTKTIQEITQ